MKRATRHLVERLLVPTMGWLLVLIARLVPLRVVRGMADALLVPLRLICRRRLRLAEANIALTFPELSAAEVRRIREGCAHNGIRTGFELMKLPALSAQDLSDLIDTPDLTPLREAYRSGHGVVVVSAHFGNWEFLGAHLAHQVGPVTMVASRKQEHGPAAALVNRLRNSHGTRIVGRPDTREMLRTLASGEVLYILPDQHSAGTGIVTDFLGRPGLTFTGPATLAYRTGAHVFAAFCVRKPDGRFKLALGTEIEMARTGDRQADIVENTRRINRAIEQAIRDYPDNWLWLHNRWKMPAAVTEEAAGGGRASASPVG